MNLRLVTVIALLFLSAPAQVQEDARLKTDKGLFFVSYEPGIEPLDINRMHRWLVHVETADGKAVDDATITLVGGMPDHDHGMPTVPQMTRSLGDGDYLVEGMKFHMNGRWVITIKISSGEASDAVTFEMQL